MWICIVSENSLQLHPPSPQVSHSQSERGREKKREQDIDYKTQFLAFAGVTHDVMSPADSWKQTALFLGKLSLTGCSHFLSRSVSLAVLSLSCLLPLWRDEISLNYTDREMKAALHKRQVRRSTVKNMHLQQPCGKTNSLTTWKRRNVSLKHMWKDTFSFSVYLQHIALVYCWKNTSGMYSTNTTFVNFVL